MKRSEAAKYARGSAAVALVLAVVTGAVYVERAWKAGREKRRAPAAAPVNVERQSSGITFSKVDQNQTIFTVRASKSTEFKGQEANLLEDVKITIFGKTGARHDTLHTQSCRYGKATSTITCSGDVQIDMQSAADIERLVKEGGVNAAQIVHVTTRGVTFDRGSGQARTDQPVKFTFPNGSGEALGVEYNSEEGTARLLRNVSMVLAHTAGNNRKLQNAISPQLEQEVRVTGSRLDFGRDTRLLKLYGPAVAKTRTQRLTAGEITLRLDATFRAEKLLATAGDGARPELTSSGTGGESTMNAQIVTAQFAAEGWVAKLEATGKVHGVRRNALQQEEFNADDAALDLYPTVNQPRELNLRGSVVMKTSTAASGDARILQTEALRVEFDTSHVGQGSKLKHAETLSAGSLEWTNSTAQTGGSKVFTKLHGDKLEMQFAVDGKPDQVMAKGNVQTERTATGKPMQTVTAQSGVARVLPSGGWDQIDLQGDVRLKEGDRAARAEHAVFSRTEETATLTGQAVVRDAAMETRAARITFVQTTGDIRAEGGVRSTDLSTNGPSVQLAPVPANISSDKLQANSKTGQALYSGHARLWQGDAVLQADAIELLRATKTLNALGSVRAVFPQAAAQVGAKANAPSATAKKAGLWHVNAGTLSYREAGSMAHLEKNVLVQSAEQRMRAPVLDLFFTRSSVTNLKGANGEGGAQQISRAAGAGGVTVEEGTRRAVGERAEYTAADGKFVISGRNPTIFDGIAGTTTGRQLTFFLADDTIIVDSENGSRTVTKHRVEK